MKKCIFLSTTIVILCLSLLSSCDKTNTDINVKIDTATDYGINTEKLSFTTEKSDFTYKLDGTLSFTVGDNGNLYYINREENKKSIVILDLDGEKINEYEIDDFNGLLGNIAIHNDILYFSFAPFKYGVVEITNDTEIYSYNFDTKKQEKIAEIKGFINVKKIVPSGNKLYLLGIDTGLSQNNDNISEYNYKGEIVKSLDLSSKKIETEFQSEKMPVMIAETVSGGVMLYAYDEKAGYYFKELNSDKKVIYNDTKLSNGFELYNNGNFEMYDDSTIMYISGKIAYLSPINETDNAKDIINDLTSELNSFVSKSGYFFVTVNDGIRRVSVKNLLKNTTILSLVHANPFDNEYNSPALEKLKFRIDSKRIDYYDFALSLLSNDNNYDIYYLDSWNDISDNIRRKGAFYSLNNVPFVKEYIDACFPYVKEAAYDENGNVWIIPISLRASAIKYNELLCAEYNIEPKSIKSLEEFADILYALNEKELDYYLGASGEMFFERYFYQIMRKNNGFNRDDFNRMAEYFYENINYIKTDWHLSRYLGNGVDPDSLIIKAGPNTYFDFRGRYLFNWGSIPNYYDDVIKKALSCEDFNEEEFWANIKTLSNNSNDLNYKHNRNILLPTIEGMTESDVTMEFVAVNPNSKNLDVTLEYISKLCEYRLSLENSFILKDKATYSDRHFINDMYDVLNYEGNFIRFSLDSELISDDFEKYLGDEISLDEYLNNIEFKLNAYLKE